MVAFYAPLVFLLFTVTLAVLGYMIGTGWILRSSVVKLLSIVLIGVVVAVCHSWLVSSTWDAYAACLGEERPPPGYLFEACGAGTLVMLGFAREAYPGAAIYGMILALLVRWSRGRRVSLDESRG